MVWRAAAVAIKTSTTLATPSPHSPHARRQAAGAKRHIIGVVAATAEKSTKQTPDLVAATTLALSSLSFSLSPKLTTPCILSRSHASTAGRRGPVHARAARTPAPPAAGPRLLEPPAASPRRWSSARPPARRWSSARRPPMRGQQAQPMARPPVCGGRCAGLPPARPRLAAAYALERESSAAAVSSGGERGADPVAAAAPRGEGREAGESRCVALRQQPSSSSGHGPPAAAATPRPPARRRCHAPPARAPAAAAAGEGRGAPAAGAEGRRAAPPACEVHGRRGGQGGARSIRIERELGEREKRGKERDEGLTSGTHRGKPPPHSQGG
ncbi:hypothetical protein PVAP13_5NG640450 [Panicum virgatum]|uniref:Uncharacterized protein n=1 Tax=Panicum virgatum TaxID=38727 RepID=A0A8T0SA01_PANVG|nr:hypothetical protein PVAP13_5NG640450 [Panicum virgatum]